MNQKNVSQRENGGPITTNKKKRGKKEGRGVLHLEGNVGKTNIADWSEEGP